MRLSTALLCDFAQVREGVLFVSSGCITRLWRSEYPAHAGVMMAIVFEMDGVERERPHQMLIDVVNQDGTRLARMDGGFQVGEADGPEHVGERTQLPLVVDLRGIEIPSPGVIDVNIYIDGNHQGCLSAMVDSPPAP